MADTKRVRYFDGANGPYEVEVAENKADEFAAAHNGYVLGSDEAPDSERDALAMNRLTVPVADETTEDETTRDNVVIEDVREAQNPSTERPQFTPAHADENAGNFLPQTPGATPSDTPVYDSVTPRPEYGTGSNAR